MADRAAVHCEDRYLEPEAPASFGVGVYIAQLDALAGCRQQGRQLSDEFVAKGAVGAAVNHEAWPGHRIRRAAQWSDSGAVGVRPVAMYFSVSGGTSPTTVT